MNKPIEVSKPEVLKKEPNLFYKNKPKKRVEVWTLLELIKNVKTGDINPDPIAQRPQVPEKDKPKKIIESLINSGTFGSGIILRDIRNDVEAQKLYPKVSYLVIDGGHRIRSLISFYDGQLIIEDVDGKKITYSDIESVFFDLSKEQISVTIYICNSEQAKQIFRNVNKVTQTVFMEDVMADEVSIPCRKIRETVRPYKEYNNVPHDLFKTERTKQGTLVPSYFAGTINPRHKWLEYVCIAVIKSINGGNVSAGEKEITELSEQSDISSKDMTIVKRFLDDALLLSKNRKHKWDQKTFGLFQLVWFGLFNKNKNFKIDNFDKFKKSFMKRYAKLTKKSDSSTLWKGKEFKYDDKPQIVTKWFYKNLTTFGTGKIQELCFEMFIDDVSIEDLGVIFRDNNRTVPKSEKEKQLALQGYVCYMDKLELSLEDAVWGHNMSWAQGGNTVDGKVIRKSHNKQMGQLSFDEYMKVLDNRK